MRAIPNDPLAYAPPVHVTVCPLVLCGSQAMTHCDGHGFASLKIATRLKLKAVKPIKGELFLTYDVLPAAKRK